ncbi:beta-hydroxylase [Planctomycetales bacterium]|nr:beta-hydroxylase [Planctomycetales bacterium]
MSYFANLTARLFANVAKLTEQRRKELTVFFLSKQMPEGSFCGRTKTGDLYYTDFAVRGLFLLGALDTELLKRVSLYLDRQTQLLPPADLASFIVSRFIVSLLQDKPFRQGETEEYACRWSMFRKEDGCYGTSENTPYSSTYTTFLASVSFELFGNSTDIDCVPIQQRQKSDGGFSELPPLKRSGTNPTAAAAALFKMNHYDSFDREKMIDYLLCRQLPNGGFQAHELIPVADLLSTFSAVTTLQDLAYPFPVEKIQPFIQSMRNFDGGYLGVTGDTQSDVEYTFYGMVLESTI